MRQLLTFCARTAISAALLYVALRGIDFAAIQSRLSQISPGWMLLALLVALLQNFIASLRWSEISAGCAAPLTHPQALRYTMIGAFFNQTLPSSIGGDAVRLWLLKRTGAGWRAAAYSVFTDRAVGHVALALIIGASLPWSYGLIENGKARLALVAVGALAIGGGLGFLLLGYLKWRWLKSWWPTRHLVACSVIANQMIFSLRSGPKVAITSLAVHVLSVVIAWCAVRSIAAAGDFGQLFMLTPPVLLITMIPIAIAGWGLREATMMVAFGYAGLSQAEGTVVSILFGLTYFALGAIGGLVWIFSSERSAEAIELAPAEES
jgi:glycosyltransferase 2 family protein